MGERVIWLVYDPESGWDEYDDEADARLAFDHSVIDRREEASECWHDDAERTRLVRAEVVSRLVLTQTCTAEDDTDEGRACREAGLDFMARGDVVETPAESAALLARAEAAEAENARLRGLVRRAVGLLAGTESESCAQWVYESRAALEATDAS